MKNANKTLTKAEKAFHEQRFPEAIKHYTKLIEFEQDNFDYFFKRGQAYLRIEDFESALKDCAKSVHINNTNVNALTNFGAALIRCQRINEAKDILEYALDLDQNSFDALINIGNVYQALNMSEKGLQIAMRAISINPKAAIAYNNLGTALGDLNLDREAKEAFLTAINLDDGFIPAIINYCQIESKFGNHLETIAQYEKLLKNKKISHNESEMIKYYLSYSYLITGQLGLGWDYYDFGFNPIIPFAARRSKRVHSQPVWNGREDLDNKRLLVWREQGLGDELEFASCLPDLAAKLPNTNITVECDARLVNIFKRMYPSFNVRIELTNIDGVSIFNDYDYQLPMGSLPRLYRRNIDDFKNNQIKFDIQEELVKKSKERLSEFEEKILVGICWRSGNLTVGRNLHYTNLADWAPLLANKNIQLVNLQYGDCEQEIIEFESVNNVKVLRWSDLNLKDNLEELIALISCLDYAATVATAVAPLAGYADTSTLLLIREDWIMLGETEFLPWSPNVKTFVSRLDESVAINIEKIVPLIL